MVKEIMEIRGFQETSFLDWDGKVCAVAYVPRCNFRCPFCHNAGLIDNPDQFKPITFDEITEYLTEHRDFIDGICLTGGEPCLHDYFDFFRKIKDLGFLIKLDTNGYMPEVLKKSIDSGLIDYIAMDVKGPIDQRYDKLSGIKTDINKIEESIRIIVNSGISYEFRTTVVPELLKEADIEDIAKYLKGAKKFALQQFVGKNTLDSALADIKPYEKDVLEKMAEASKKYIPNTILRGV